jgi:hypothetical protein
MGEMVKKELLERLKTFLITRKRSYQLALPKENLAAQAVLKDLAIFCRANTTTFHPDPRIHAALEGRREVWLRIQQHLNLTADELVQIYGRKDLIE